MSVLKHIVSFFDFFRRKKLPPIRYSDPSHAQYDPTKVTLQKSPASAASSFPRIQIDIRRFQDTDKMIDLTLSCIEQAGTDGASGGAVNFYVAERMVGDVTLARNALNNKLLRERLKNIRMALRAQGKIGYSKTQDVWFFNSPIITKSLTEKEEKYLASKGLSEGWRRIDRKTDAVQWLYETLTALEFEGFCVSILREHCDVPLHITQKRKSGADGGFDGEGTMLINGKTEYIALQAKQYASHNYVGEDHLAKFVGVLNIRGWNHGFMMTTSRFSDRVMDSVKTLQKRDIWIELIDSNRLADIMLVKTDTPHGFGLHQTDLGLTYMNEDILREAAKRGL